MHRLKEVACVFLKLGTIAFGGPAAHIAMMNDELVEKRKWVDRETFLDLLGAANLIPGPNSTELAIHLGYKRAGWLGLITAGACFILPAMLTVWALAALYGRYQKLPELSFVLYGIKPVIIAVVGQALWGLAKSAVKNKTTAVLGSAAFVLALCGLNEILLLLLSGFLAMVVYNRTKLLSKGTASAWVPAVFLFAGEGAARNTASAGMSLAALFWTFLKIGSVLYGSGYVLLAFLQSDFVDRSGALTSQQLLDAVAVGQFTPGPVFTTATFIGYLIHGSSGALLATLGIFLPAFVFVAVINPWVPRLRKSSWFSAFLDGVNVASLALMGAVAWQLCRGTLIDGLTVALTAVALFLLIRFKVNSVWLVIGGGVVGWIAHIL
jgi:chromate transporter